MDAVLNRRSVRTYKNKKIEYAALKELCRYGEAAPSARNQRSREYIIVDDLDMLELLSRGPGHADFIKNAAAAIVVIGTNPKELSTPHMQPQDLACTTENILIKATDLGIGSCYIGVYPVEERMNYYHNVLNLPQNEFVFCLIALGYPETENVFYDKNKWDDALLHHNRYE